MQSATDDQRLAVLRSGSYYKYLKSAKIYRCPFDIGPYSGVGPCYTVTSYGMNGAVNAYGAIRPNGGAYYFKTSQFRKNAIIFWEAEPAAGNFNDGSINPSGGMSLRHTSTPIPYAKAAASPQVAANITATVTHADGSASTITIAEYLRELDPTISAAPWNEPTQLWCIPKALSNKGNTIDRPY